MKNAGSMEYVFDPLSPDKGSQMGNTQFQNLAEHEHDEHEHAYSCGGCGAGYETKAEIEKHVAASMAKEKSSKLSQKVSR